MSVNSKLTAIADELRTLGGRTDTLTLDEMATVGSEANVEISSQTDLISQIATALEGKAAGGGSGGSSVETCTVTFTTSDPVVVMEELKVAYTGADLRGRVEQWKPNETVITVIKGSVITVYEWSSFSSATNATLLYRYTTEYSFRIDGDAILDFVM